MFGRLLRPHPRVLGIKAFAFLPGVSSPDLVPGPHAFVAIVATPSLRTVLHIFLSSLILSFDSFNY